MKKKILGILIFVLFFGFIFADEFIPERLNENSVIIDTEIKGKKANGEFRIINGTKTPEYEVFIYGYNENKEWELVGSCVYNKVNEKITISLINSKTPDSYRFYSLESLQLISFECEKKINGQNLEFKIKNAIKRDFSDNSNALYIDSSSFLKEYKNNKCSVFYKFEAYIASIFENSYDNSKSIVLVANPNVNWNMEKKTIIPEQEFCISKFNKNVYSYQKIEKRYNNSDKYEIYAIFHNETDDNEGYVEVVDIEGLLSIEELKRIETEKAQYEKKLKEEREAAEQKRIAEQKEKDKAEKNKRIEAKGKEIAKGYIYHGVSEGGKNSELFDSGALETGHAYYIPAYIVYAGGSMGGAVTNLFYNPNWQIVTYASQKVKGEVVGASKSIFGELPVSVIVAGGKAPTFIPVVLGLIED